MRNCDIPLIKIIAKKILSGAYIPKYLYSAIAKKFKERTGINYTWRDIKKAIMK